MKFKFVLMLLIGMISFTALATTPVTDQKHKTDFVQHQDVVTYEVNVVEYTMPSILIEAQKIMGKKPDFNQEVSNFTNHLTLVPVDVGWRNLTLKPNQQLAKSLVVPVDVGWRNLTLKPNQQLAKSLVVPVDVGWRSLYFRLNMKWPIYYSVYRWHYKYKIPIQPIC